MNCCKKKRPVFKFALRDDLRDEERFIPKPSYSTDTGFDVRSAYMISGIESALIIQPNEKVLIPLGFRAFCPPGYWFKIVPRSSTFGKKHMHCLYGTVDESYTGECFFAAHYIPPSKINGKFSATNCPLIINFGDAIGQLIPVQRLDIVTETISNEELDALDKARGSARGSGALGSTDGQ